MLASIRIEDIDRLLNELETLARSSTPRSRFLHLALERLRFLLSASATAILLRSTPEEWMKVAVSGPFSSERAEALLKGVADSQSACYTPDQRSLAIPIRDGEWQRGALMIDFQSSPGPGEIDEYIKLARAFAEVIALRQLAELETFVDQKWSGYQRSLMNMGAASSSEECAYGMVNDLATLVKADRVSLVQSRGLGGVRALAVSGVIKPERKATAVVAVEKLCKQVILSKTSQSLYDSKRLDSSVSTAGRDENSAEGAQSSTPSKLLANFVCIPVLKQHSAKVTSCDTAVLFEWNDYDAFLFGCTTLNYLFPPFATGWLQHQRWLRFPAWLRRLFDVRPPGAARRLSGQLLRLAMMVAILVAVLWGLNRPVALRIESEGTLQPVEQRVVFAPLDGVVSRLLVTDGQHVEAGEPLAEMYSPMLELDIQAVLGDIRANAEKRDGLNLAINQLSRDDPKAYGMQSRLSSEIRELEIQLRTYTEKHLALLEEQEKLVVRSPIAGAVVARQAERYLDSRPVRRGDSLLKVVNLDGPWQLELLVRDQDSGYVKHKLFSSEQSMSGVVSPNVDRQLQFAIASQPDVRLDAQVNWMSESARNPNGDGMFVDLTAEVGQDVPKLGHMGATVYAYIDCGQKPFWFVWTRPLIEAIQRKLWF